MLSQFAQSCTDMQLATVVHATAVEIENGKGPCRQQGPAAAVTAISLSHEVNEILFVQWSLE